MRNGFTNVESDEASRLLAYLPSPQSTDKASSTTIVGVVDYGINRNDDASVMSRVPSDTHLEFDEEPVLAPPRVGHFREKIRRMLASAICRHKCTAITITLLLAIAATHSRVTSGGSSTDKTKPSIPSKNLQGEQPFSTLDPVHDLGLYSFDRPYESSPEGMSCLDATSLSASSSNALPSNAWYENVLLQRDEPTSTQRAYTVPYVVDMVGPIPGLRMHPNHIVASQTVMQLDFVPSHGLTMGMAPSGGDFLEGKPSGLSKKYTVTKTTPLGLTLAWGKESNSMSSSIVRGMPFATMHYRKSIFSPNKKQNIRFPTIVSEVTMHQDPIVDGTSHIDCNSEKPQQVLVSKELELTFYDSDFTWLVFFSEPVYLTCRQHVQEYEAQVGVPPPAGNAAVVIQVVDLVAGSSDDSTTDVPLTVRMAPLTNCTHGHNPIYCRVAPNEDAKKKYAHILRKNANLYPGPDSNIEYAVNEDIATLTFDWDVHDMRTGEKRVSGKQNAVNRRLGQQDPREENEADELKEEYSTFALPHHMEQLKRNGASLEAEHCQPSLRGAACMVSGSTWTFDQDLPPVSFRAPRPPSTPESMQAIADALEKDIEFTLPTYYQHGVGDTYFSGKMLAKLARILVIADEMLELCPSPLKRDKNPSGSGSVCANLSLPSESKFERALHHLRSGVEIWINGTGAVPFVYDKAWGGVVNCGCDFDEDTETCRNQFPNCPAFSNPGLNFGNGFYNDHHFHLGYHIYAAAVVAQFDPEWGERFFEQVLLLIRDIANPSTDDRYFPRFRHKDWYNGNSWASGISSASYLNGKNQESSSEAIASYEAVALYGSVMHSIWRQKGMANEMKVASNVFDVGRLLTATELQAADWYWHVRRKHKSMNVFPTEYNQNVVGVMWSTMAQFQTWFGNSPYLPYGIQLLPITSVSEQRDKEDWVREAYHPFADSCDGYKACKTDGWSVLQYALLATVGHKDLAIKKAQALDPEVFESAGGNGHSLSNTLWYISTRPESTNPLAVSDSDEAGKAHHDTQPKHKLTNCGCPETCTDEVLGRKADGYSCRERIQWVMDSWGYAEDMACSTVAGMDFPHICGACNPTSGSDTTSEIDNRVAQCPPCSDEICSDSILTRCPKYDLTYVCTDGPSRGGCSPDPWYDVGQCQECCELNSCRSRSETNATSHHSESEQVVSPTVENVEAPNEEHCPPCSRDVCQTNMAKLCPVQDAPYLCSEGTSTGGCSPLPWEISVEVCNECCKLSQCAQLETVEEVKSTKLCPPCSKEICRGELNQCPIHQAPFLCTGGVVKGGCSAQPWQVGFGDCDECCVLTQGCSMDE